MLPDPNDPRFSELAGEFQFACGPQVDCFNECCRRLNLILTPYDVLRLKKRLGMTAGQFLEQHAVIEPANNGWPMPRLQMNQDAEGACPFVTPQGCSVYPDRPGACRTYPLGRAAKGGTAAGASEETFFLVKEEHCHGFAAGPCWAPQAWTGDQGLEVYNAMNDAFLPLITRPAQLGEAAQAMRKAQMFFMACYNLDAFRQFVEKSSLSERFDIPEERLATVAKDEEELLKFAFDWLAFSLYGDPTLQVRPPSRFNS